MAALCAALLLAWPALANEATEAGDQDVGAVVEEGQLPPSVDAPPVEAAPPIEEAAPGEAEEGAEASE
jgi:hypothetical protein